MIAHDAVSSPGWQGTAVSHTWAHTCTGLNRMLTVFLVGSQTEKLTHVKYDGVEMTIEESAGPHGGRDRWDYALSLVAPVTGGANIVITFDDSQPCGPAGVSYTGVLQGAIDSSAQESPGILVNFELNITIVADNCWLVGQMVCSSGNVSSGGGTTTRNFIANSILVGDSNGAKTPAGAYHLDATTDNDGTWTGVILSLAPTPEAKPRSFGVII